MNKRIPTIVRSHRTLVPVFLILGALLLGVASCASGSTATPLPVVQQATSTSTVAAPVTLLDVNSMNACALFPEADVAAALGVTQADPNTPNSGAGPTCTYFLLPAGAGAGDGQLYNLFIMTPDLYDPSLGSLENAQPVTGLGDQAMIGTRVGTTLNDIMVKTSGIFIEVNGPDAALVKNLAEYVLTHLP